MSPDASPLSALGLSFFLAFFFSLLYCCLFNGKKEYLFQGNKNKKTKGVCKWQNLKTERTAKCLHAGHCESCATLHACFS